MTHEVFQGSVQLTGKSISPTLERRGVILMSDGANNNVESQGIRPQEVTTVQPYLPEAQLKSADFAWQINKPDDITFRLQARAAIAHNADLAADISSFTQKIKSKPLTEWTIDEYKDEFDAWQDKKYKKQDGQAGDDPSTIEAQKEVKNLLVESVLQRDMDVAKLIPDVSEGKIASLEKQEKARKAHEALDGTRGKPLTTYEKLVQERMIKLGIPPIAGGAQFPAGSAEWNNFTAHAATWASEGPRYYADLVQQAQMSDTMNKKYLQEVREKFMRFTQVNPGNRIESGQFLIALDALIESSEIPEVDAADYHKDAVKRNGATIIQGQELSRILNSIEDPGFIFTTGDAVNIVRRVEDDLKLDTNRIGDATRISLMGTVMQDIQSPDNEVRKQAIKELHHRLAMKVIEGLNPAVGMPEEAIDAFIGDTRATKKMIIKIISTPLAEKMKPYQLGFYEGINIGLIKQGLNDWINGAEGYELKSRRNFFKEQMGEIIEGTSLMHQLHMVLSQSRLQEFSSASSSITASHLNAMLHTEGTAMVKRIIDLQFSKSLSVDGKITKIPDDNAGGNKPGNYDQMFGYLKDGMKHDGSISELYEGLSDADILGSDLEDYERDFAKNIGQYVYAIFLRGAEMTAQGEFDFKGPGEFVSRTPYNDVSAIFNYFGFSATRWGFGDLTGGQKLLEMTGDNYDKQREQFGYRTPLISKTRGSSVKNIEYAAITGSRGFNRSWREAVVHLMSAPFYNPESNQKDSITSYVKKLGEDIKEQVKHGHFDDAVDMLKDAFLDADGELLPHFNNSLGVIQGLSILKPQEADILNFTDDPHHPNRAFTDAKLAIREAIWKRTAQENPVEMITFLQGMKILDPNDTDNKHDLKQWKYLTKGKSNVEVDQLRQQRDQLARVLGGANRIDISEGGRDFATWNGGVRDGKRVGGLELKLLAASELRLQSITRDFQGNDQLREVKSIDDILNENQNLTLSEPERELLNRIRTQGQAVASEMATIRFAISPFMNDVIYERSKVEAGGDEVFRSVFGDVAQYHGIEQKLTGFLVNPGKMSPEKEVVPMFAEMVNGLADPLGTADAQDFLYPFMQAYLDFIWQGGIDADQGKGRMAEIMEQWNLKAHAKQKWFKLPTSLAQKFTGNLAPAYNIEQMDHLIKDFLLYGCIRKQKYDEEYGGIIDIRQEMQRKFNVARDKVYKIFGKEPPHGHHAYITTPDSYKKLKKSKYLGSAAFKLILLLMFDIPTAVLPGFGVDTLKKGGEGAL